MKIKHIKDDYDLVFINELSPIMSARPGIKYAKKHHKKVVMYEMDLWPESLLAGKINSKSLIYKIYKKVSAKIYSQCDLILVSTKEHISYIKSLPGCKDLNIKYLPQYSEDQFENSNSKFVKDNNFDLLFAGNIGKAQSVETIVKAANILKNIDNIKFHILGDGSERIRLEKLANSYGLNNIFFYGKKPINEVLTFYNMADAMLISLVNESYSNLTIPGKTQSYMAYGKPIIGSVNGATANLINEAQCGFTSKAEDYVALANLIKKVSSEDLKDAGENGKKYYQRCFKKEKFITELVDEFNKLVM